MIYRTPYFKLMFVVSVIMALLHIVAEQNSLYWILPWYDIMMHFIGGLWSGVFVLWFYFFRKNIAVSSAHKLVAYGILGALTIGLAWEIFEYVTKLMFLEQRFILDTTIDLVMDMLGGAVAGFIMSRKNNHELS